MIRFFAKSRCAHCVTDDKLTKGSVGIEVRFYLEDWDAAPNRVAVFKAGSVKVDVALLSDSCTVPPEVLANPGDMLVIGVYGTDNDGDIVIPTVYAEAGRVRLGTAPTGISPTPTTQPLIDQLVAAAEEAERVAQSVRDDADAGNFNGESAYQIAVDNGYVGTEEEWIASLHGQDATLDGIISPQAFKNLFDPNDIDIVEDYAIAKNNVVASKYGLLVSGYIPVKPGETYIFPVFTYYFGNNVDARTINGYDESKTYVGNLVGSFVTVEGSSTSSSAFCSLTIPSDSNVRYIRVNASTADTNYQLLQTPYHTHGNFMVVEASEFPLRYFPYTEQSVLDAQIYSGHEDLINPLYGKRAVFLGDSICQGDTGSGWAGRIGRRNTMLWENDGVNGATISTANTGKVICNTTIKMADPDFIIFEGGTNDADRIGSIISGSTPAAFGTWSMTDFGTIDAETYYGFDIDTFCGAFEYLCKRLVSNYPGSKIGYIVAHKMGNSNTGYTTAGSNRRAYFETAMQICEKWGIPYLNLWDGCYLNPKNPAHYTSGADSTLYSDGQHLTSLGYEYITPIIEAWMRTLDGVHRPAYAVSGSSVTVDATLSNVGEAADAAATGAVKAKADEAQAELTALVPITDHSDYSWTLNRHIDNTGSIYTSTSWAMTAKKSISPGVLFQNASTAPDTDGKYTMLSVNEYSGNTWLRRTLLNPGESCVIGASADGYRLTFGYPSAQSGTISQAKIETYFGVRIVEPIPSGGGTSSDVKIPMGALDGTSTATVMTAAISGITSLADGVCVWLTNGVIASASGVTLNINGLGAKPIYNSLTGALVTTTFTAASTYLFVYNSTRVTGGCWDMVYGYDTNTTYTPVKLGFGYTTCSTAEATAEKTAALSSYTLTANGIVSIKFTNDVPANATLNINSKGAKAIYYRGAAITSGVIKAGDTATFIYSTCYHLISIDRQVTKTSDLNNDSGFLTQHQDISGKLNIDQGSGNAGKFLVVGNDGNVTAVTMAAWQGGNY